VPKSLDLAAAVTECIADYLDDPESRFSEEARAYRALPVYAGIGGLSLLRSNGEVVTIEPGGAFADTPYLEEGDYARFIVLVAAHKYLPLRSLVPVRPTSSVDCELCNGSGKWPKGKESVCGACCGHGWDVHSAQQ
jgi:hypothetical protein